MGMLKSDKICEKVLKSVRNIQWKNKIILARIALNN